MPVRKSGRDRKVGKKRAPRDGRAERPGRSRAGREPASRVSRAKASPAGRHAQSSPAAGLLAAVDVGNTQTVLGIFEGEVLRDLFRLTSSILRTGDELLPVVEHMLRPWADRLRESGRAVIGSVVPPLTPAWEALFRRMLGRDPLVASAASAWGLAVELRDPASIGVDRIANAIAVSTLHRLPAVVVDLGTATTLDVVLPGPRYLGGIIAPGIVTSAEELFRRAARLAKVEIRRPAAVLGRTTEESVQSGVFFGAVSQIDGLIRRLRLELAIEPFVIATGGLAEAVAHESETIEQVDPALTLQGLRIMAGRGTAD